MHRPTRAGARRRLARTAARTTMTAATVLSGAAQHAMHAATALAALANTLAAAERPTPAPQRPAGALRRDVRARTPQDEQTAREDAALALAALEPRWADLVDRQIAARRLERDLPLDVARITERGEL